MPRAQPVLRIQADGLFGGGYYCAFQSCLWQQRREGSERTCELQQLQTRGRTSGAGVGFMRVSSSSLRHVHILPRLRGAWQTEGLGEGGSCYGA